MSFTYKQIAYLFDRSIEWMHISDETRVKMISDEMALIDWDQVPDDGSVDYIEYYKKDRI